jgi:hypothetical protein
VINAFRPADLPRVRAGIGQQPGQLAIRRVVLERDFEREQRRLGQSRRGGGFRQCAVRGAVAGIGV